MSSGNLFSTMWHRAATLRPKLRSHIQLHRQHYRGDLWYVVQDHASGRFFRFTPAAHALIGLMDGRRTLQEIWELAADRLEDDLPSQDETIQLLSQLHTAGMLASDSVPDVAEMSRRAESQQRQKFWKQVKNPLGIRIPMLDPDRFLDATFPLVRPLYSRIGLLAWAALVLYGVVLAGVHWEGITSNVADRVLAADNLLLMFIAYPLIKALHELGHGYAVKRWGGEVHEMGVMLMVLMPIPYVDASASTAYQRKHQRIVVGAAGIMVELAVASIALIIWTLLEPGFARALAYNVMFIGGVSTLLFNGNPLLRFDGYYIFSDLIEMPNLGTRSNRYIQYLVRKHAYRVASAASPVAAPGERPWLFWYGILASIYRVFIMVGITLFVASQFFFIGIALAIWSIVMIFVMPAWKWVRYLAVSPELDGLRARAVGMTSAAVVLLAVPLVMGPVPHGTVTQGVVTVPERAQIYAGTAGFVSEMHTGTGGEVKAGDSILKMGDPILNARAEVLDAELDEARVRLAALEISDRVRANVSREEVRRTEASLLRVREALAELQVDAPLDGKFVVPSGQNLEGRFLGRGELIGYVLAPENWIVRAVVGQNDIDLIRARTHAVSVRFVDQPLRKFEARVIRATPQATDRLPSPALGTSGGGAIALDPTAPEGGRALSSVFVIDLEIVGSPPELFFGARTFVRFDHGSESIGNQLYRAVRQAFLHRFAL